MYIKKLSIPSVRSYEVEQAGPSVAFECPTCTREVSLNEIIEEKGTIRCVKCSPFGRST
ncbi:MAG: hypothetical protein HYW23_03470 [Candidatus Aenigmarchaeota archaeon]|nr:hypothetical protein [Candidatus Aenigmarchaeota archaeon]